jgi:hypothetical protein
MAAKNSTQGNGLLCWLRCDEASGDLIDSNYEMYNAQAQGNINYQQPGKPNVGLGFGVSPTDANPIAIIQKSDEHYWNSLTCKNMTVQVWFKANSDFSSMPGAKHALIYKSSNVGDGFGWYFGVLPGGGNTLSFRIIDSAASTYTADFVETDFTQFHHYVGVLTNTKVYIYRDGVEVAQTAVDGTIKNNLLYLVKIGEGIDGTLDEIAVWNRALTANEISQLYGLSTYSFPVLTNRIEDAFFYFPNSNNEFPNGSLYSWTMTIGPFVDTVEVRSGDDSLLSPATPMTTPNNQWVINGVDWTNPAWVNVNTAHTIAVGTVIATLTPGQTVTIQIRSKENYRALQASGRVTAFKAGVAGDGYNIILATPKTLGQSDLDIVAGSEDILQYVGMADGLIDPVNTVPVPFDPIYVSGDFGFGSSMDSTNVVPTGTDQSFDVFEKTYIDPLPVALSITADQYHLMTLTGEVGSTNIDFVDLYWEVELLTGSLVIPVSPSWTPFTLHSRQQFVTTYQIPSCISLNWKRARFVAEANGPGATDKALRYESNWLDMIDIGFINSCQDTEPKLPRQIWVYQNVHVVTDLTTSGIMDAIATELAWTGSHWEVDQFVSGNYLTIKRKAATPGTTIGDLRAMVFGRRIDQPSAPSQAALVGNDPGILTPAKDTLYIGICDNAATTPASDPTTGSPWPGLHWSGGVGFGGQIGTLTGEVRVITFSCQQMLVIIFYGENGWAFSVFGECIIGLDVPTVGLWGCMASGPTLINPSSGMDAVLSSPIPGTDGPACSGSYHDGTDQKRLVRSNFIPPVGSHSPLYSADKIVGYLLPIVVETGALNGSTRELVGTLRQITLGPYGIGRKVVKDGALVPRAIFLNGGNTTVGSGLYLNQDA